MAVNPQAHSKASGTGEKAQAPQKRCQLGLTSGCGLPDSRLQQESELTATPRETMESISTLCIWVHSGCMTEEETQQYLVKLFQAIFSLDTGLFNIIVNSIKDCTLSSKRQCRRSVTAAAEPELPPQDTHITDLRTPHQGSVRPTDSLGHSAQSTVSAAARTKTRSLFVT